ncbi:MAG: KH domain-containing protein [Victivallales bacterium]|nr:KH domain-containing protein [Victivallales bacterium]
MSETLSLENAKQTLAKMLELLGVQAEITLPESEDYRLFLKTDDAGRLIGKKGQTLEALELVLNRILKKDMGPESSSLWVSLDIDGYQVEAPRHEAPHGKLPSDEIERLQAMAKDIAKEVKLLHRERVIGPFNPAERRIIHVTLEDDPVIETVSDPVADEHRGKKITVRIKE